ncbi:hypothetical protein CDAR_607121 [Caerostris darwini]|uniref:Uncharacterized protein n=1 Tax=Caerostris darwini TaxID=1538125 RepID=A0AAV4TFU8_9ARAC|nr:hypothetical protein CDAR_607121 [Caerostris darwini]
MSAPFVTEFSLEKNSSESPKLHMLYFIWGRVERGQGGGGEVKEVEFAISFGYRCGFINGEDFCSIPEREVRKDSKGLSNRIKNGILLFARENPRGVEN